MGFVTVPVEVANPADLSKSVIFSEVLIDTGATTGSLPRSLVNDLGLPIIARRRARTMQGSLEMDVARAMLTIGGERTIQELLVSDTYNEVIIGVVPLETLGFAVDPVNNRIVPVELLLL